MRCTLLCVGKLRERHYRDAADEYLKRLRRFGGVEEVEVPDVPEPDKPGEALEAAVRKKEGERLLRLLKPNDFLVALCIEGKQLDSPAFAAQVAQYAAQARGRVVFVIGGSLGLDGAVTARAQARLSLSRLTLPHQLARVVLLEQLFRAAKINHNEGYHK